MSGVVKIFSAIFRIALIAIGTLIGGPLGGFIGALIGSILTPVIFGSGKPSTRNEIAKVNVRIAEPIRWLNAGQMRQGGSVLFAEFDASGNLWYLVVHSDSILVNKITVYLDEIPVTLDGSGNVTTGDFCLDVKKAIWQAGTKVPYFQIWTTTYTESNPTPPAITALSSAFPSKWTSNHKLVGTTYSVVKVKALAAADRSKIYKWRGPLGMGEPGISIIGDWSHAYDPRDGGQINGTPTTYLNTRNAVLVWAWFRTHRYGRNKPRTSINWTKVAEQAAICDQTVTGLVGSHTRYRCDVAIPEDRARSDAEQEIMLTADMQLVFDDDGKCWPRVGYYVAPTLSLTRNRDIVAMESVEAQNGESETQGVVIRYTDPAAKYTAQPSAAWINPFYYVAGQAATFLTIDALGIQDHNQAMRIAKAVGLRLQPPYKIAPTIGLRGLKARQERIISINYDNTFAGDHEICTQVEVDAVGVFCGMGLVPVNTDRWNLLAGEEQPKPVVGDFDAYSSPAVPTGVTVYYGNGRIEATFTTPGRDDVGYEFEYILTADISTDMWADMTVKMINGFAYSGTVAVNSGYSVRYRAIASSGRVSDWSSTVSVDVVATGSGLQSAVYLSFIVQVLAGTAVVSIASNGTLTITTHTRRYSDGHADLSVTGATISTGLAPGAVRAIGYDDAARVGGAVTYNLYTTVAAASASAANPGRHFVGYFTVPASGSSGGDGGGGGGYCVADDTLILIDSAGAELPACELQVGDMIWTQHEHTMKWGAYPIEAIEFVDNQVFEAPGYPRSTPDHRFWIGGEWVHMREIGTACGTARVAKITVTEAHTYVSAGVLSHNLKPYI